MNCTFNKGALMVFDPLSNRPLTAEQHDLWVVPSLAGHARQSIEHDFNLLVSSEPGGGGSTLLAMLAAEYTPHRRVVPVNLMFADSPIALLQIVVTALGLPIPAADRLDAITLTELGHALAQTAPALLLLDNPPADHASWLFGHLRDLLFCAPHTWVMVCSSEQTLEWNADTDIFLGPPRILDFLNRTELADMLTRRLGPHDAEPLLALATVCDGRPRHLLQLAREAQFSSVAQVLRRCRQADEVLEQLGPASQAVVSHLRFKGPASGADPRFLAAMGFSAQRARELLNLLEARGIAVSYEQRTRRPGRPCKRYQLTAAYQ